MDKKRSDLVHTFLPPIGASQYGGRNDGRYLFLPVYPPKTIEGGHKAYVKEHAEHHRRPSMHRRIT
jgi:hypothetical protein